MYGLAREEAAIGWENRVDSMLTSDIDGDALSSLLLSGNRKRLTVKVGGDEERTNSEKKENT
jgi:hypothetical protein